MKVGKVARVLFLGGLGRSGTTLVERVLGELPGVCALGEVVHLWQRDLRDDERCGCGARFSGCAFWTAVGDEAFGGWRHVDVERVLALQVAVERTRHIPRLAAPRLAAPLRDQVREYAGYYAAVYRAAAAITGAEVVVDSSKHSALAHCLRWADLDGDLRVAHVVRDPRGVAYSWTKTVPRPEADGIDAMTRYSPARSALLWNAHNAAFALLARCGVAVRRVRYEEFLRRPAPGGPRTSPRSPGSTSPTAAWSSSATPHVELGSGHTAAGNPMRFTTGRVPLRRDDAWLTALPEGQRRLVGAVCAPAAAPVRLPAAPRRHRARPSTDPGGTAVSWPSVGVVIPTRNRPRLLRRALDAVLAQDYPGPLRVVVVHDQTEPDQSLAEAGERPVAVLANWRTPGLAGARNTGILALDTDLVAFCDDDDAWAPAKLSRQVAALRARPGAEFVTCAIEVEYDGRYTPRLAGRDAVTLDDLARSRMAMLHSSTFLVRRTALTASDRAGRHRAGRRGRAGQPERGLGPAAARRPAGADRARRRAAGPGAVGAQLALRVRVRDEDLLAALDDRPAPRDPGLPARRRPGLRPARLLVGGDRQPAGGLAVDPQGGPRQLARAPRGDRARRA